METHEYASIFPMMNEIELNSLREDMRKNGFRKECPITLYQGKILDGRNRFKVAQELGVEPAFMDYDGDNPLEYIIALNISRRHLNESQRAICAMKIANMEHGGDRKSNQAVNRQLDSRVSQSQAANLLNSSLTTIARAKLVEKELPELLPSIERGEMTINEAWTEVKRKRVLESLENIEIKQAKEIEGVYDVIVVDPPWEVKKIELLERPGEVELDYPTMTLEEIEDLDIPAAKDCHIFLWTTQRYLPHAFNILKEWDANYICTFVWHKNGGYQPMYLPQYNCEFVLYARIGAPKFIDFKNFNTCFSADRTRHSEKPEEFYELLRRVTGGRRLDMFSRRNIEGFDSWGKEA